MLALPIPILTFVFSAVACVLVWRMDLGNQLARNLFTAAFALISIGTLLIGLRYGYGFEQLIFIQRVIPLFIGPVIFLGFLALTRKSDELKNTALYHLGVALFAAVLPQLFPPFRAGFDIVIGASYLFYCFALLLLWRKGADNLSFAPLGMTGGLRKWMLCAAIILGVMLIFDTTIAISFALQRSDDAVRLISIGSFISMISLIFAIVAFTKGAKVEPAAQSTSVALDDESIRLEIAAREFLKKSELYLDTDLTLERLAKRLHVPARALSEAINKTQSINVSQYVNGFRLEHAAELLKASNMSVTRVLEQSGFLTRSNFYREFERVFGQSPVAYRKQKSAE